jgi:hypothetical protein
MEQALWSQLGSLSESETEVSCKPAVLRLTISPPRKLADRLLQ